MTAEPTPQAPCPMCARSYSQDYMIHMPDGTEAFYRTAREAPIGVLVGITYDGKQEVYRWTSQEKLIRLGMNALRRVLRAQLCGVNIHQPDADTMSDAEAEVHVEVEGVAVDDVDAACSVFVHGGQLSLDDAELVFVP